MALTQDITKTILARAKGDPAFRLALLKELVRLAVDGDPKIVVKALQRLEAKTKKRRRK